MQPKRLARVLGPYQEGPKWRVITITSTGRRSQIARSEAAARQLKSLCIRQLTTHLPPRFAELAQVLRGYEYAVLRHQRSRQTWTHTMRILRAFLPNPAAPITAITPQVARQLAHFEHPGTRRIRRCYAVSTRRAVLDHVRCFYDWAQKQRYIQSNPFVGVQPIGIVGTAMRRMYPDEVPRFIKVSLAAAESGDVAALGALLLSVMKLRSGQVLSLRVADVDLAGQRLQVRERQATAWRFIPQALLQSVRSAVESRAAADLVFGPGRTGSVRPRNYLWRTVHRLCLAARVTPTNPRALRLQTRTRSTSRPSRKHVVTFARKHRLRDPVLVRRRPARPSSSPDAPNRDEDYLCSFPARRAEGTQRFQRLRFKK